jgi:hypothetical protein
MRVILVTLRGKSFAGSHPGHDPLPSTGQAPESIAFSGFPMEVGTVSNRSLLGTGHLP